MKIVLDCGVVVFVEGFLMDINCYRNILAGHPTEDYNESIINHELETLASLWGDPVHLIRPETDYSSGHPYMPCTVFKAWLLGPAINSKACGSSLGLLWFDEEPGWRKSIPEIVDAVACGLPWRDIAGDFDW